MKPAPPTLAVYWQAEVRKTDTGKLVRRTRRYRCRSFVNNFLILMNAMMGTDDEPGAVDTSGSAFTAEHNQDAGVAFQVASFNNDNDDEGIVVGSGNTAVTGSDNALDTLITEGTGAGQLEYPPTTSVGTTAKGASITSFDITRSFSNGSGGNVSVNEIGLICRAEDNGGVYHPLLIIRDVTDSTISVSDGETLTVTYTLKTVV